MEKVEPLIPGKFYHIYNRGINGCDIFPEDKNFDYFLKLYKTHVSEAVETFSYCLLRNHFHLLVRIKETPTSAVASKKFGNLFNAYAQGFNRTYSRTGGLFESPFHRKPVENNDYQRWLVWYIHANPQRHGLTDDFRSWPASSYTEIVSPELANIVNKSAVIRWFDGIDSFLAFHLENKKDLEGYVIEF